MRPELQATKLAGGFGLLEGARWYERYGLVFSDMTNGGVFTLGHHDQLPVPLLPHRKAIGGLVAHADGGLVISGRNVSRKVLPPEGDVTQVYLEAAADEQFFNDITADGAGRIYAGSVPRPDPGAAIRPAGRLYRIGLDLTVDTMSDDVLVSNGLGTDPSDEWLYHVDSDRHTVWTFPLDGSPIGTGREVFADTSEYAGVPDGLAVAADGSVWVAMAGGSVVVGWDRDGRRIAELGVSQALVTSVCFGGPGLETLYVLTGCNADHPDDEGGCVYTAPAPCAGLAAPFARVRR